MLILFLPMAASAIGENIWEDIGDYIGPDAGVGVTLLIVSLTIALDVILGIFLGIKQKEFDFRILPQFLFTGVLPFIGGLSLLAILAYYIDVPFTGMFFTSAVATAAKYLAEVWDKLKLLFGITLLE